jgi:hypothetical protein
MTPSTAIDMSASGSVSAGNCSRSAWSSSPTRGASMSIDSTPPVYGARPLEKKMRATSIVAERLEHSRR